VLEHVDAARFVAIRFDSEIVRVAMDPLSAFAITSPELNRVFARFDIAYGSTFQVVLADQPPGIIDGKF
jgi:hypothetical protein